ncbi:hypothetical protein LCGC14_0232510 [marine sediment metagenome]|uniref:Uncharacterized protein n=1 Tax=marine sediment metagenome TaxID=412755 RepID=A0A0F9UAB2_9ZZZZ
MPFDFTSQWVVVLPPPGMVWNETVSPSRHPRKAVSIRFRDASSVTSEGSILTILGVFKDLQESAAFRDLYNAF